MAAAMSCQMSNVLQLTLVMMVAMMMVWQVAGLLSSFDHMNFLAMELHG